MTEALGAGYLNHLRAARFGDSLRIAPERRRAILSNGDLLVLWYNGNYARP